MLVGAHHPTAALRDLASAAGAALVRWAEEFLQAVLPAQSRAMPVKDLVRAWKFVQENPPKGWAQVRGPIGAATLLAKRL